MDRFLKPLGLGLIAIVVAAVIGIGVFKAQFRFVGNRVQAASSLVPRGPNIILITLDTVRADHFSAYGYPRPTTPNLDRVAREGVLFENAISAAPWTLSSHASIFTGLLPHQHGADWATPLLAAPYTLAEVLSSRGYQTAGFVGNENYLEEGWGIAQGFETYQDGSVSLRHNLSETLIGNAIVQPGYQRLYRYNWFTRRNAEEVNRKIFRWFRHRSKSPFFLFINYMDVHDPYLPPTPYDRRFGHIPAELARKLHRAAQEKTFRDSFSLEERKSMISGYDNSLAYLDDQMGELLQFLRRLPGWQNTLVIITSDHGEEFGEHGRYTHGFDLYRETLHVPLIMEGPGIPQNLRIAKPVATRALFQTVLDVAEGGNTPFDTHSLARYWSPNFTPGPFDDFVISELVPAFYESGGKASISLTTQKWHYIYNSTTRQELYDWNADPKEQNNLAGTAAGQKTVQSLYALLIERIGRSTRPWWGTEYLLPLGRQGPFLHDVLLARPPQPDANRNEWQVGSAQAHFLSRQSWKPLRPAPSEQDLMQSLPYH